MKPGWIAGKLVQPGLLGTGQDPVAVLDGAGHDREPVGFELGQTDDDVRVDDGPGNVHRFHEIRIKGHVDCIEADVAIVATGGRHETGLLESRFIGAVAEKAGIVAHDKDGRCQGFHFVHHRSQHGRMGDNALDGLRSPQHVGFDHDLLAFKILGEQIERPVYGRTDGLVACRMDHDLMHGGVPPSAGK